MYRFTRGNSSFATGFSDAPILIPWPFHLDKYPTSLCLDPTTFGAFGIFGVVVSKMILGVSNFHLKKHSEFVIEFVIQHTFA
jgi:hypothetical protein